MDRGRLQQQVCWQQDAVGHRASAHAVTTGQGCPINQADAGRGQTVTSKPCVMITARRPDVRVTVVVEDKKAAK